MNCNIMIRKDKVMISGFFDLKSLPAYSSPLNAQGRNVDESGENDFRTIAPADIPLPFPENRRPIQGESSHLTNLFAVPAKTVANIYRQRWRVELFFKWIK